MFNLCMLYADNNSFSNLVKVDRLTKPENLSLQNQSGRYVVLFFLFSFTFHFDIDIEN